MLHETVNINYIIDNLNKQIKILDDACNEIYSIDIDGYDTEGIKYLINILVDKVNTFSNYWSSYSKTYKIAVERDVSKLNTQMEALKIELNEIRNRNTQLTKELESSLSENTYLKNQLNGVFSDIDKRLYRADIIFDEIEKRIGGIAMSRKMKEYIDRTGENSPVYRCDIRNEDLLNDYINAGYKITKDMCKKYNTTYPTIKYRLKQLGVYKDKRN